MITLAKTRWLWFFSLIFIVISSNILIYRLDILGPIPKGMALGSLFDCMVTIPLITYFFIIRKRYSSKYLIPVVFVGYGAAHLIIPQGYLSSYSFVKYLLIAGEGAFFLVELYILFKLVTKLPAIIKYFQRNITEIPVFSYRIEKAISHHIRTHRLVDILSSEITLFYYSLFSWRKKPIMNGQVFTFHKKTSGLALYIMLIHALILESVGFHFLLHSWSEVAAIIALILNGYTLLFCLAEIQAIRLAPFIVTNQHLYLQVGIVQKLMVPLEEIKSVHSYKGPEKLSKEKSKFVFDGVLSEFIKEKPTIEIEFHRPLEVRKMYGFKQHVRFAHLRPDEPQKFLETLNGKLSEKGWL
jgi:hypothetical protein